MTVYNSKTDRVRQVDIKPTTNWNGTGLLGVSIKFDSFESARKNVWHILNVEPNSPAELAGLQSNCDYVIGADSLLQDSEDLYALIEAHDGKPLKLFVYNLITDNVREVVITPNSRWGGEGLLGCGIGYGYLHRIPDRPKSESSNDHTPLMHAMHDNEPGSVADEGGDVIHSKISSSFTDQDQKQVLESQSLQQSSPPPSQQQQLQRDMKPQISQSQQFSIINPVISSSPSMAHETAPYQSAYGNVSSPYPPPPNSSGITTKLTLPGMNPITVTVPPMPPHILQPQPSNYPCQLPLANYSAPAVTIPTNTITSPISIPGIPPTSVSYQAPENQPPKAVTEPPPPPPNSLADFPNMPRFEDLRITSTTHAVSNYPSYLNDAMSNVNVPYSQPSQPYSSMVSSNFSQSDYSSSNYSTPPYTSTTTTTIDFSQNSNI